MGLSQLHSLCEIVSLGLKYIIINEAISHNMELADIQISAVFEMDAIKVRVRFKSNLVLKFCLPSEFFFDDFVPNLKMIVKGEFAKLLAPGLKQAMDNALDSYEYSHQRLAFCDIGGMLVPKEVFEFVLESKGPYIAESYVLQEDDLFKITKKPFTATALLANLKPNPFKSSIKDDFFPSTNTKLDNS